MRSPTTALLFTLLLLSLAQPCTAGPGEVPGEDADPVTRANAATHFANNGQYQEAAEIWAVVVDELPPGHQDMVRYNLGNAYRHLGRLQEAYRHLSLYPLDGPNAEKAGQALHLVRASLEATHSQVTFLAVPFGATVRPSGEQIGETRTCPATWWLPPGEHRFEASLAGFTPETVTVTVAQVAREQQVRITLSRAPAAVPSAAPVEARPPARPVWAWATLGGGLAAVASGAICYGVAYARNQPLVRRYGGAGSDVESEYLRRFYDRVLPARTAAYVLWGVGAAAAGAGAAGLLWPRGGAQEKFSRQGHVALTPMPEIPLGLGLRWSF